MPHYKLTIQAEQDYRDILSFTLDKWGVNQLEKYATLLDKTFDRLAGMPGLGNRRDDIRPGYYRYHMGRHYIFYRVVQEGIEVVRILDDRRQIEEQLFPM
ncbi:type II toxin-antitoxin system RelE/ParE family toxin [Phormidesmis sp. 146-12]